MTGGLMQVVSNTGSGDIYLTGNPHITLYKKVYRRHTHFAVEAIEQIYDDRAGSQITTNTRQYSVIIAKSGDLINQMFFEIELPALTTNVSWVYGIGNAYIKKISLSIGGQVIDTLYSDWMNIWGELTTHDGHRETYDEMVGNYSNITNAANTGQRAGLPANTEQRVFVPLPFWFCRNVGQSLPLIALQNAEIKLDFEFRPFNELYVITSGGPTVTEKKINARLWIDYIFLDNDERRRFSQVAHEYLIEQVQWNGGYNVSSGNLTRPIEMQFNHPIKEIIWANISNTHNTVDTAAASYGNSWFNYAKADNNYDATNGGYGNDTFTLGRIVLNGQDKITPRDASYFRKVQNYEAHTNIPRTPTYNYTTSNSTIHNPNGAQYIYTYSFALSPEEHQPTGSCNFSKLDTTYLNLTYNSGDVTGGKSYTLNIYATNYNILRIQGGQGGIAYSN